MILLADRGLGRAELAKTCDGLRLRYLAVQLTTPVRPADGGVGPFPDGKDGRFGLGLGQTQGATTARLDRLILILALALILLTGLGRLARGRFAPRDWCSSNGPNECSDATVGRRMWDRIDETPEVLIDLVVRASYTWAGNWDDSAWAWSSPWCRRARSGWAAATANAATSG